MILVNGTEGEPGSAKDKMLLLRSPYLVLGGALLACRALGGKEIVVGVAGTGPDGLVGRSVTEAAAAEPELKALVRVVEVPDRFVSGEGGALVNAVNGKPAIPPGRKRRASDAGVDGLPTLLSNAETFAQLAVLAMLGPDCYASIGTADEPGTVLLTELNGHLPWPGMYQMIDALGERHCTVRVMGSSALSLAQLAAGRAAAVVLGEYHPVDAMAGLLIAAEAGAVIDYVIPPPAGVTAAAPLLAAQVTACVSPR